MWRPRRILVCHRFPLGRLGILLLAVVDRRIVEVNDEAVLGRVLGAAGTSSTTRAIMWDRLRRVMKY